MSSGIEESWEKLEAAQAVAARKKEVALMVAGIPNKVLETHGQFTFGGWVARSRVYTCLMCERTRTECLGVFSREEHSAGGTRYTLARDWPQEGAKHHEVERIEEPYCFECIQELGFSNMVDAGERKYAPQEKFIERGITHIKAERRIVPASVGEVLSAFKKAPRNWGAVNVQDMLDELSDGSEQ